MSTFGNIFKKADALILKTFEETAIWQSKEEGSEPVAITGITSPSPLDSVPFGSTEGVANVYFFVWSELGSPQIGDVITYGGVSYDILNVDVDREGGSLLKLKKITEEDE